jgi:putative SOS response-associated peptidase YedK
MKDGRPSAFAPALEKTGKIPNLENGLCICTIITGEPNELVAKIHPRLPVISS